MYDSMLLTKILHFNNKHETIILNSVILLIEVVFYEKIRKFERPNLKKKKNKFEK